MEWAIAFDAGVVVWGMWLYAQARVSRAREGSRFRYSTTASTPSSTLIEFQNIAAHFDSASQFPEAGVLGIRNRRLLQKMLRAGLYRADLRGFYLYMRRGSVVLPILGMMVALLADTRREGLIVLSAASIMGILIPRLWLAQYAKRYRRELHQHMVLLVQMIIFGTRAGWETTAALERTVALLDRVVADSALFFELKKNRLLVSSGYTWAEALDLSAKRLGSEEVERALHSVAGIVLLAGNRERELEHLLEQLQSTAQLDEESRTTSSALTVIVATLITLLAYLLILLAPALAKLA